MERRHAKDCQYEIPKWGKRTNPVECSIDEIPVLQPMSGAHPDHLTSAFIIEPAKLFACFKLVEVRNKLPPCLLQTTLGAFGLRGKLHMREHDTMKQMELNNTCHILGGLVCDLAMRWLRCQEPVNRVSGIDVLPSYASGCSSAIFAYTAAVIFVCWSAFGYARTQRILKRYSRLPGFLRIFANGVCSPMR
jgi:hypothetical protein